jgi:hypothetical protein
MESQIDGSAGDEIQRRSLKEKLLGLSGLPNMKIRGKHVCPQELTFVQKMQNHPL